MTNKRLQKNLNLHHSNQCRLLFRREMGRLSSNLLLSIFTCLISLSETHKILGVFPTQFKSHWTVGISVLKPLVAAGHEVTLVSPFELKDQKVRNVILTDYPQGENRDNWRYGIETIYFLWRKNILTITNQDQHDWRRPSSFRYKYALAQEEIQLLISFRAFDYKFGNINLIS